VSVLKFKKKQVNFLPCCSVFFIAPQTILIFRHILFILIVNVISIKLPLSYNSNFSFHYPLTY